MRHNSAEEALSVVSYLFLFTGLVALGVMLRHLFQNGGHINWVVNFGVLGLGIFWGLRKYSAAWRTCALCFTWYGIVVLSAILALCLYHAFAKVFLTGSVDSTVAYFCLPVLGLLFVSFWQVRILTHPAVRRLFNTEPKSVRVSNPAVEVAAATAEVGHS